MVRIADRPAAPSISNLHELNRSGREQWPQIPALIANVLAEGVLLFDQFGGRGRDSLLLQLGHFGFVILSLVREYYRCGARVRRGRQKITNNAPPL